MESILASPDVSSLLESARDMLGAGRLNAARPLLAALERIAPGSPDVAELAGMLAAAENRLPEAIAALERVATARPEDAELRLRLAGVRHRAGDLAGALRAAADAVIAEPQDAAAKALLGLLLLEAGDAARARTCLGEASTAEPDNAWYRIGFAEAALRTGDADFARTTLEAGIARAPGRVDLREAAIRVALGQGDVAAAQALAEAAQRAGLANAGMLRMCAEAAAALGRESDTRAAVALALKLDPSDLSLRHVAACVGLIPAPERAPAGAVRAHFESRATRFADEMIAAGDRVPGLIRAAVLAHCPRATGAPFGPVLDLGCGTGLVAVAMSDLAPGPWIGVDLAPGMLARASPFGLYAELIEADIEDLLARDARCFPLVLAADVLPWFGALEPVFAAIGRRLAPGGLFIFSLEQMDPAPDSPRAWVLSSTGRYKHERSGVEHAARASGLALRSLKPEALRNENGEVIAGLIGVLERVADGA